MPNPIKVLNAEFQPSAVDMVAFNCVCNCVALGSVTVLVGTVLTLVCPPAVLDVVPGVIKEQNMPLGFVPQLDFKYS
jgi:hypothetical protein